jgi:hypothetical protein
MASSGVVPDLDVVVDCAGELDTSLPSFAVQQLDLHPGPERLDHGIVERGPEEGLSIELNNLVQRLPVGLPPGARVPQYRLKTIHVLGDSTEA